MILPYLLQTGAKLSETSMLDTGNNIMKDVAKGRSFRSLEEGENRELDPPSSFIPVLNEAKTQKGGSQNRKRKILIKDFDHSRSKKKRSVKRQRL